MADMLRKFIKHMDGLNKAALADTAAKAMAEHCDERMEKARKALSDILEDCRGCSVNAAEEGKKGEARAWRAMAARIAAVHRNI